MFFIIILLSIVLSTSCINLTSELSNRSILLFYCLFLIAVEKTSIYTAFLLYKYCNFPEKCLCLVLTAETNDYDFMIQV